MCFRCNFGLTYFAEDSNILDKAAQYIHTAPQRGKTLDKELDKQIQARETEKEAQQSVIKNSKTREIQSEDADVIITLCKAGSKLREICDRFPQYSRSSINRLMKKSNK